ncbi:hypothetical protein BH23BAC3_BH23BAC3_33680 [soil metagenome]
MAEIRLITCVGVEHDLALLPHFLRHYTDLGILPSQMHIILQASRENSNEMKQAKTMLVRFDVIPAEIWIAPYTSDSMWEKRREIQQRVADGNDWVISADVDEFHEFPDELHSFLSYCEKKELNCVQGVFIDRLAPGGQLDAVKSDASVWEQFPIQADVICTIRQQETGGWENGTVNIMACKGNIMPSRGGHGPIAGDIQLKFLFGRQLGKFPGIKNSAVRFSIPLRVHHFKWTNSLLNSLKKRLATPGVSPRGKSYGQLLLQHIEEGNGIQIDKMPVRTPGLFNRLPWRIQITALNLRTLSKGAVNRIRRKLT